MHQLKSAPCCCDAAVLEGCWLQVSKPSEEKEEEEDGQPPLKRTKSQVAAKLKARPFAIG